MNGWRPVNAELRVPSGCLLEEWHAVCIAGERQPAQVERLTGSGALAERFITTVISKL